MSLGQRKNRKESSDALTTGSNKALTLTLSLSAGARLPCSKKANITGSTKPAGAQVPGTRPSQPRQPAKQKSSHPT
jgi:hypothetical protein